MKVVYSGGSALSVYEKVFTAFLSIECVFGSMYHVALRGRYALRDPLGSLNLPMFVTYL
ncbi:hypothetical protein [Neorickettsia sp. 179522]|uniref:hypothetical protein n=1 Tax=Neorickettsia sp. 179522 TaxID=1714371 RepID=UPI000A473617|nr:hypothetical protein [Neorickettsia sp. 179522]